jgi:hypothetical protein
VENATPLLSGKLDSLIRCSLQNKFHPKRIILLFWLCYLVAGTTNTKVHGWTPQEEHPCNIRVVSLKQLYQEFGPRGLPPLHTTPIVIKNPQSKQRNAVLQSQTQRDTILSQFPANFTVTLSSSNALSEHRRTIPLQQYLKEIASTPETFPTQLSNETWYLFGETFDEAWQRLLTSYVLPPCQTCQRQLSALSFGIGNRGSGVQWHTHGPGFSEPLHGRKHWVLYPPHHEPANIHKDQSSRQWMEVEYPQHSRDVDFYECTRKKELAGCFLAWSNFRSSTTTHREILPSFPILTQSTLVI